MTALILASRSPRRRELLERAGFAATARPADLDDADLTPASAPPRHWVAALAYLKAARVASTLEDDALVLGADTVVVKNERIIGQPRDAEHARSIIRALSGGAHTVATGVAILRRGRSRTILVDQARVEVGEIPDAEIARYVDSGDWRGKAGAYNLAERQAAGWPVRETGDPATVMGLPMRRLGPILTRLSLPSQTSDTVTHGSPAPKA